MKLSRILIGHLHQESHSFNPVVMDRTHFSLLLRVRQPSLTIAAPILSLAVSLTRPKQLVLISSCHARCTPTLADELTTPSIKSSVP